MRAARSPDRTQTTAGAISHRRPVARLWNRQRSGGSGIRTHGAHHPTVFKTVPFGRSGIPPSTILTGRDRHRILVLDRGRVVGTGTHTELMTESETYREIVLSQLTEHEALA